MANLQVKNLPDGLLQRLRHYAQKHNRTISDIAIEAMECEMTRCEWNDKLSKRPITDLGDTASLLLDQERWKRERETP